MKERPILFSAPMVRAILEGGKMQTRRVVKRIPWKPGVNPGFSEARAFSNAGEFRIAGSEEMTAGFRCPYGQPGDRLWVRETFCDARSGLHARVLYRATGDAACRWTSAIHMPRWASRLTLEVAEVRVERLQEICEGDAIVEGCPGGHGAIPGYGYSACAREHFQHVWESINGAESWAANPWVWAISFRRV